MKKSFATVLSLTVLTLGAFAQAPSPAPAPDAPPKPENRERMQQRGPGGQRVAGGGMGGMEGREMGMERIMGALAQNPELAKKLNLTPDQQDMIKKMALEQRIKMVDQQAAMQKTALKQADLLMADPLDEAALMTAVEETSKARTAMAKAQIQNLIEIRKVLTEEQRKQLREMMTQMRQRPPMRTPGEGRENREGRGPKAGEPAPGAPAPAPAI